MVEELSKAYPIESNCTMESIVRSIGIARDFRIDTMEKIVLCLTWECDHCSIVTIAAWTCSLLIEIFAAEYRSSGVRVVNIICWWKSETRVRILFFFLFVSFNFNNVIMLKCRSKKRKEKKLISSVFLFLVSNWFHRHLIIWSEQTKKKYSLSSSSSKKISFWLNLNVIQAVRCSTIVTINRQITLTIG